jgi:hypothetical protein
MTKLSDKQLGLIARSGIEGAEVFPGKGGNSAKGLERLGLGEIDVIALAYRTRQGSYVYRTVYRNLEPGMALVCSTCQGRGGMDMLRPHIQDCTDCEGKGAHQPAA